MWFIEEMVKRSREASVFGVPGETRLRPLVHLWSCCFLCFLSPDIRDTVNYKEVMKQYGLGPNGGIVTSLNLFATRFDQVTQSGQSGGKQIETNSERADVHCPHTAGYYRCVCVSCR